MLISRAIVRGHQDNRATLRIFMIASAASIVAAIVVLPKPPIELRVEHQPLRDRAAAIESCTQKPWPYYDAKCLWRSDGVTRPVRVIAIDRLSNPPTADTAK